MTFLHLKHLCIGHFHHTTLSLVQFQHSSTMTFLHLKHLCMGHFHHMTLSLVQFQHSSVMTFFALKTIVSDHLGPFHHITSLYPWFSFNIQVWWPFCSWTFMCENPPPHQFIFGSVSTFKHDNLSALEHLCFPSTTPKTVPKSIKLGSDIHT